MMGSIVFILHKSTNFNFVTTNYLNKINLKIKLFLKTNIPSILGYHRDFKYMFV